MRQPSQPIFRFAPSPNGRLHLGHAYSALYSAFWAQKLGGALLLRIEDIDLLRCRPEFVTAIFDDLAWLGIDFAGAVRRQSEHFADYGRAADRLRDQGLLYPCFCSRSAIRAVPSRGTDPDGAPLYPGICRHLSHAERAEKLLAGVPVQWRIDMEQALERAGPIEIAEALPDPDCVPSFRSADPRRWGDVVIVRKDTPTSYHLSVVVDDGVQGVTHVTRGMDLYAATDIHRLLQALLGVPSPLYTHHRLILDEGNEKLAKSNHSESLADLRAAGWSAKDVRAALGWSA